MSTTEIIHKTDLVEINFVEENKFDLNNAAYENIHEPVFHAWLKLNNEQKDKQLQDRYVFYSVACTAGQHLENLLRYDFEEANNFVESLITKINILAKCKRSFNEEWYKGINQLVGSLTKLNFLPEARSLAAIGLVTGVKKYPRIAQSLSVHTAYIDALLGRRDKASKVALRLVQRPYLLPNKRELAEVCYRLMYILASGNKLIEYRLVAWVGVNLLIAPNSLRDRFAAQIELTYRGTIRALIRNDVPLKYRFSFLLSNVARLTHKYAPLRWIQLDKPIRWIHLGYLFAYDRLFLKKNDLFNIVDSSKKPEIKKIKNGYISRISNIFKKRNHKILITRAMGGIGDILMMTPGLRALTKKYPNATIDFAIPKTFHPILEGLNGVRLLDIDEDVISLRSYNRWVNLTDCPAGRVEAKQHPNVRRNRIEIFAKAMGITKRQLKASGGMVPYYKISKSEYVLAKERVSSINIDGRKIVGIQPYAADSYRNWPHMEELVKKLSEKYYVLIFHHEQLDGYDYPNVIKINESIRDGIALASVCDTMIVPDSSFLHISAALNIPTIAIFGAISGRLRTKTYRNVQLMAPNKKNFPCYPCWRHEHKPCHLSNGRESICLQSITLEDVYAAISTGPDQFNFNKSISTKIFEWILYGSD